MAALLGFPDTVNETSARVVSGGVVSMATASVALDAPWLMVPLVYGYAARVLTGPRLSPLGQLATKVITPRIDRRHAVVPGPPKRLAQALGLSMSSTALVLHYGFGRTKAARAVLGVLIGAAGLEAFAGYCVGCRMFPLLIKAGVVPEEACERCANIWSEHPTPAGADG